MNNEFKVKKTARICRIVASVVFLLYAFFSVVGIVMFILYKANPKLLQSMPIDIETSFNFAQAVFVLALLICLVRLFSAIENEKTPFCHNVNLWLKRVSIVILLEAILSGFIDKLISSLFSSTVVITISISVNIVSLLIGLALLLLSYIFEYGIELQRQDDETL